MPVHRKDLDSSNNVLVFEVFETDAQVNHQL